MQNEILELIATNIVQRITSEVHDIFAISVDETKDISKTEQISLLIRYVYEGKIHEEFVGYRPATGLDAESLNQTISKWLRDLGLPIQNCISQSYDGASVMSGCRAGVQALFRREAPKAIYIHCKAHKLNLALVDVCKGIPLIADFF